MSKTRQSAMVGDVMVYEDECRRCGADVRLELPVTVEHVANPEGERKRCPECGTTNYLEGARPEGVA